MRSLSAFLHPKRPQYDANGKIVSNPENDLKIASRSKDRGNSNHQEQKTLISELRVQLFIKKNEIR